LSPPNAWSVGTRQRTGSQSKKPASLPPPDGGVRTLLTDVVLTPTPPKQRQSNRLTGSLKKKVLPPTASAASSENSEHVVAIASSPLLAALQPFPDKAAKVFGIPPVFPSTARSGRDVGSTPTRHDKQGTARQQGLSQKVREVKRELLLAMAHGKQMLRCMLPVFFFIGLGMLMGHFEGWTMLDSIYYSCITITTIGYGDVSPGTENGQIFAIFFIPLAVISLTNSLGALADIGNAEDAGNDRTLMGMLGELEEVIQADDDGTVTPEEYVLYNLKKMGKVDQSTIDLLMEQFSALDADGSGELDSDDITMLRDALSEMDQDS